MKKVSIGYTIGLLAAPILTFAQSDKPLVVAQQGLAILNVVVSIVFVIAIIVFGWGIVKLIIAAGDPTAIKQARGFLLWGIIGIVVLASVFGIITYVQEFFGVPAGPGPISPPSVVP